MLPVHPQLRITLREHVRSRSGSNTIVSCFLYILVMQLKEAPYSLVQLQPDL